MTAATSITEEQTHDDKNEELRNRLIAFAREGARVFCTNRFQGGQIGALSGFIASVSIDHVVFDSGDRSIPIRLAAIIEVREHTRRADPPRVMYVERVKDPA